MRRKDAIAFCRYYKGEQDCPYRDHDKEFCWFYEQAWVYDMTNNTSLAEYIGDFIGFGLGDFSNDDGVPLSLKALLFNRYAKSCHSMQSAVEPFMVFYKRYYKSEEIKNEPDGIDDKFKREVILDSPTPNGGVRMIGYFFDKDGNRCEEEKASQVQILEFDENDVCVFSIISEPEK